MEKSEGNTEQKLQQVAASVKKSLKEKHGDKLRSLEIPKDDLYEEHLQVLVVVPNRSVVGQYLRFSRENPKKAQEILVKHCVLTSKEEIMEDDALFYATATTLIELIPIREGKLGKL